jgi:aminoglycoside 6-adenylyltransferase
VKLATDEQDVLERFLRWIAADARVRAALLTSSRTDPTRISDLLSDYDIALLVRDVPAMAEDERWAESFGVPRLRVRDAETLSGAAVQHDMILYGDGTKIDYTLWPAAIAEQIRRDASLPADFDGGYRVLLDKDGLIAGWPAPAHSAYVTTRPTAREFQGLVEEFWFVATYVAKNLWRGEDLTARVLLDQEVKYLVVWRMLDWRIGIDQSWSVAPGFFGRGMARNLDDALWDRYRTTYSGLDAEAIWQDLDQTIVLFRDVASSVARDLGYDYPIALDAEMMRYLEAIRSLPPWTEQ